MSLINLGNDYRQQAMQGFGELMQMEKQRQFANEQARAQKKAAKGRFTGQIIGAATPYVFGGIKDAISGLGSTASLTPSLGGSTLSSALMPAFETPVAGGIMAPTTMTGINAAGTGLSITPAATTIGAGTNVAGALGPSLSSAATPGAVGGTAAGTTAGVGGGTVGGVAGGTAGGTIGGTAGGAIGGTAGGTIGGTAGGTIAGTAGTVGGTAAGTTAGTTATTAVAGNSGWLSALLAFLL